jgi:S-formylglutathione hydrolase
MYSYVTRELPELIRSLDGVRADKQGIFGHSMGGHGARVCALRNPQQYSSVSAFAPIAAPPQCPWGEKAFSGYLGPDKSSWQQYDASVLVAAQRYPQTILIDQGRSDKFLDEQLKPSLFEAAARTSGTALQLNYHEGYDHGYYFIASFVAEHLRHHAQLLK